MVKRSRNIPHDEPEDLHVDDSWVIFRLSSVPIVTEEDGDFHCVALMDMASGYLLAYQMIPVKSQDEFGDAVETLLKDARKKGVTTRQLVVPSSGASLTVETAVKKLGIHCEIVDDDELVAVLDEPKSAFAAQFGGRMQ